MIPIEVRKFAEANDYEALAPYNNISEWENRDTRKLGPYIPVALADNFPVPNFEKLLNEIKPLRDNFVPHRGGDGTGWEAITLYGLSSTHTQAHSRYGYQDYCKENRWTDVSEYLPACKKFIKRLPYKKFTRVRIMKVAPGGYIAPHIDRSLFVGGALNIAINNPKGCKFYVHEKGYLPFDKSYAIYPNTGMMHSVVNDSDEDRYHFIVHGEQEPVMYEYQENALRKICSQ